MIEISQLKKSYGKIDALKGVDLKINSGIITGLVGPNACGKTTLIKSVLGLVVPDAGVIKVQGKEIDPAGNYRRNIGYLPQNPDFPSNLSVCELLDMMEDLREQKAVRRDALIDLFELKETLSRSFGVLSGGTKQKIAALLAFMFDPAILILDEPTVGLDPVAVLRLKGLMKESAQSGKAILLVSHIMTEVEQLVGEMVFLLEGKILISGSPEAVRTRAKEDRLENAVVHFISKTQGESLK